MPNRNVLLSAIKTCFIALCRRDFASYNWPLALESERCVVVAIRCLCTIFTDIVISNFRIDFQYSCFVSSRHIFHSVWIVNRNLCLENYWRKTATTVLKFPSNKSCVYGLQKNCKRRLKPDTKHYFVLLFHGSTYSQACQY